MKDKILSVYQRFAASRMFSRWAPIYELEVEDNAYSAPEAVARSVLPLLQQYDCPVIVDAGIGTGLLAQQIYDALPCRIIGLDYNEDMMAACAGRGVADMMIRCDVGKDRWPLENGFADCIISAGLMEYLTPPMLQHFMEEAARIMQQKSFLVFTYLPHGDPIKMSLWRGHSGTYLTCGYSQNYIEELLRRNGFKVLSHSLPFKGCVFEDGSSYDYRLVSAERI